MLLFSMSTPWGYTYPVHSIYIYRYSLPGIQHSRALSVVLHLCIKTHHSLFRRVTIPIAFFDTLLLDKQTEQHIPLFSTFRRATIPLTFSHPLPLDSSLSSTSSSICNRRALSIALECWLKHMHIGRVTVILSDCTAAVGP